MHASTALLAVCSAVATLVTSSRAKPLALSARQVIAPPPNTTSYSGLLIELEETEGGSVTTLCPGLVPVNDYWVAINPWVWKLGFYCGGEAIVTYEEQSHIFEIVGECLQCGENDIGLYPASFQRVIHPSPALHTSTPVYGEWVIVPAGASVL